MSCWVVPTVAAEYWGLALDIVWRRIYEGLVPHKTEEGFVFIDVDPWTADSHGNLAHEPPLTFVPASDELALLDTASADLNEAFTSATPEWSPADKYESEDSALEDPAIEEEVAVLAHEDGEGELAELDEEETATFGRLSWQDVRSNVSRTRRPPPSRA